MKYYEFDEEQVDLSLFKKEFEDIYEKQQKFTNINEEKKMTLKNSVSRGKWLFKFRDQAR